MHPLYISKTYTGVFNNNVHLFRNVSSIRSLESFVLRYMHLFYFFHLPSTQKMAQKPASAHSINTPKNMLKPSMVLQHCNSLLFSIGPLRLLRVRLVSRKI